MVKTTYIAKSNGEKCERHQSNSSKTGSNPEDPYQDLAEIPARFYKISFWISQRMIRVLHCSIQRYRVDGVQGIDPA
jgi:hypothetical protein